jgi:hypothetical protein
MNTINLITEIDGLTINSWNVLNKPVTAYAHIVFVITASNSTSSFQSVIFSP